ncbi:MAG: hypothetical protein NTV07_02115 [Candidatus Omnitrophica bacterium]|nr:hypothetical protein [Candidatus Omnitrophota bacterium]
MENLLDQKEAAALLGVDEKRFAEMVDHRVVPGYMVAGQYLRFKKEEIEIIKQMLTEKPQAGRERMFNRAFTKIRGREKFKEFIRAHGIYLLFLVAAALVLFFVFFH